MREEHTLHVAIKLVPLETSNSGKITSEEHELHALLNNTPLEVSIKGKLVNAEQ